ncbi:MAG: hypothetical protein JRF40_13660 [Deltaproteobacteria bacterium]|nr:hypothetical protein [Deltaproteobacteria bacterium]
MFPRKFAILSTLVVIAGCSSIGCISIPLEPENHETIRSLHGAWILFSDDEDPEEMSPHEKIINN